MSMNHIIVDFEMTPVYPGLRERSNGLSHEIVEFGAVRVDGETLQVIDTFQCLVKPMFVRKVDSKVARMTGITTKAVADAPSFPSVLSKFLRWVGQEPARIYSWSDNDLFQLKEECACKDIPFPCRLLDWLDLQAEFPRLVGRGGKICMGLSKAAHMLGIPLDPDQCHEALYDAQITTKIFQFYMTGSYQMEGFRVRPAAGAGRGFMTYRIADTYSQELSALLSRLRIQEQEEMIHFEPTALTRPVPVLVR